MSLWRNFERRLDGYVDQQWGEPVEIHPMLGGQEAVGTPQPDPNRSVLYGTCVYMMPGARAFGEGGTLASGLAGQSEAGVLAGAEWISITEDQIVNPANWQAYDRVYLPERGTWHNINMVIPSTTGRYRIDLTRVQE